MNEIISLMAGTPPPNHLLDPAERAIAQRLTDEINQFNLDTTGIRAVHEVLKFESDDHGEVMCGVYGWCWGGTCWIDALWVREDARRHGLGGRLLDAVEVEARAHGCHQIALETHTFQAPTFYERKGFEVVGSLADYPLGHGELLMRKPLAAPLSSDRWARPQRRTHYSPVELQSGGS